MSAFDDIRDKVAAAPDLDTSVTALIDALATRIKATSNDQNVQKLARELKAAAPALAQAVSTKPALAG